jgi:hypothetical protein
VTGDLVPSQRMPAFDILTGEPPRKEFPMKLIRVLPIALLGLAMAVTPVRSQEADQAAAPEIGAMAPDFELPGATRYGVLQDPVRLSDFRGKTVVLAFFFRVRTRG